MCKPNTYPQVSSVIYPLEFGFKGRCLTSDSMKWYLMHGICYMTSSAGEVRVTAVENTI